MIIALTSDFPSTANQAVINLISTKGSRPRIAWIPPNIHTGQQHFEGAKEKFLSFGFANLEFYDLKKAAIEIKMRPLNQYDVIYLSGGSPVEFQRSIVRAGLDVVLKQSLPKDALILGASGGAMQFTPNISLFRLLNESVEQVFEDRREYDGLGMVGYELLPHLNRLDTAFLDRVREYSRRIANDIMALADGAAVIQGSDGDIRFDGQAMRFRNGLVTTVEELA